MFLCLYVDVLCVIVDHESCKMLTKQPRVSTKLLLPLTFFVRYYQRFVFFLKRFLYRSVDVLDVLGDGTTVFDNETSDVANKTSINMHVLSSFVDVLSSR